MAVIYSRALMIQRLARARPARWTRARAPQLRCEGRRAKRARSGNDHRRGRLAKAFRQRQRGRAKAAFRQGPANKPMGPAATRAMVDLILAIDGMVAAP